MTETAQRTATRGRSSANVRGNTDVDTIAWTTRQARDDG